MNKIIEKVSLALSGIFSPLLVPTYACAIALWITPLSVLAERTRFTVSLIIFVITAVLPMATILLMMRAGKVSDTSISNRRERGVPYVVTTVCYLLAALFLWYVYAPHWLAWFYFGAAVASLIAVLVNIVWKISAHATTMGGLCAMFFYIIFHHIGAVPMVPWVCGAILFSGAVCSARLFLKRHSPMQVYAGFFMGLAVEYIIMSI